MFVEVFTQQLAINQESRIQLETHKKANSVFKKMHLKPNETKPTPTQKNKGQLTHDHHKREEFLPGKTGRGFGSRDSFTQYKESFIRKANQVPVFKKNNERNQPNHPLENQIKPKPEENPSKNPQEDKKENSLSVMEYAQANDSEGCLKALKNLKNGDLNDKNSDGWTALHFATWNQNQRMVSMLLERGATVDSQSNEGLTPLMISARKYRNYQRYF